MIRPAPYLPVLLLLLAPVSRCGAEQPASPQANEANSFNQLVRTLVLLSAPLEYENTKDWGHTKRMWDGLKVSRRGLKIRTKRRWKDARHGTWNRYKVWLIDPDRHFDFELANLRLTDDNQVAFELTVDARLGAFGRLSEWQYDVQLYSLSAEAEARIRLWISFELSARLDTDTFPPDVVIQPMVSDAKLQLVDFRLHRISDADGPLVKQLGKGISEILEDELRKRRGKLVKRMNLQIAQNEDDLRFSLTRLYNSGWQQVLELLKLKDAKPRQ
jgi:hypothetical protein